MTTNSTSQPRLRWLFSLLLVGAVCAVFWPALRGGFLHWDDGLNILDNPHLGFNWDDLKWMFTDTDYAPRYLPLGWFCYAMIHVWFGSSPLSFHVSNLLLHSVNTLLLFAILIQILRGFLTTPPNKSALEPDPSPCPLPVRRGEGETPTAVSWAAAGGALWWAVNPLRAEPVAWSSSLIYLVAAMLFFLAILVYLRQGGPTATPKRHYLAVWLAAFLFTLSLLTYPIAIGGLAVFVALDFFPLQRLPLRPREWFSSVHRSVWWEKLLFLIPALAVLLANIWARLGHPEKGAVDTFSQFGIPARLMQALWTCAWYVWKHWLPFDLTPLYPDLLTNLPFTLPYIAAAALVAAISVWLFLRRRAWPWVLALWLCYLSLLAPFTGLGDHPHFTCDRYSYIVGSLWALLIAGALLTLAKREQLRLPLAVALLLLCSFFGWQAQQQSLVWNNSLSLHTCMAEGIGNHPERAEHDVARAVFLLRAQRPEEATVALRQALAFRPEMPEAWGAFGDALADQHRLSEAIASYERALHLNPGLGSARQNLAVALAMAGQYEQAVSLLNKILLRNPDNATAHYNLALALHKLGREAEAQRHMEHFRRLQTTRR